MNPNKNYVNDSTEINIKEFPKKINEELSSLKTNTNTNINLSVNTEEEKESEPEIISQSEEMIKKQRQITNFDSNNVEQPKTNNILNKSYFYHKVGNCHAFFGNNNGDPIIIIGPQWPMFIALTLIVNVIVWFFIIRFWFVYSKVFKGIGIFCVLFFQITFTHCFIINPGFPKNDIGRQTGIPKEQYRFCPECKFYYDVNKNVNHCFDCGICIEGYDHHCPWTSKCIGKKNLYSFYCFMTGILLNFGFAIICVTTMGSY